MGEFCVIATKKGWRIVYRYSRTSWGFICAFDDEDKAKRLVDKLNKAMEEFEDSENK